MNQDRWRAWGIPGYMTFSDFPPLEIVVPTLTSHINPRLTIYRLCHIDYTKKEAEYVREYR